MVLATFCKNDNSSCFWYTNSFNWKSSLVLIYYKSEDGYPNFLFSYLLLIALYINSTYIIWLKKIFCCILFSKFLTRDYFLFFVPSSSIADSGTGWLDTYIKTIVICRDIHRTLRTLKQLTWKKYYQIFYFVHLSTSKHSFPLNICN